MVCVPSRSKVSDYMRLKREIDETIGRVNGKFANVNWTPIWYYYRSFGFDDLIDLYTQSDIAMVTPLRDGMNLVAKEYLATRVENDGVLILSELAGASKELHQALIVNPFDINELADSIYEAIKLSKQDQIEKNIELRERVKRYNVNYWSTNFIQKLNEKIESIAGPVQQMGWIEFQIEVIRKLAKKDESQWPTSEVCVVSSANGKNINLEA